MIYFDNAATTFQKPKEVPKSMLYAMRYCGGNAGRGGHRLADAAAEVIYGCRESIASLLHIPNTMEICFTANATLALNYAIKGVLKPEDHCIISSMEHNSVFRPVYKTCAFSVCHTFEEMENAIRENTKLIVVNHCSNIVGTVFPMQRIGKIASAHGIPLLVDASQSAGHVDIDVQRDHIDMLAASGHKGLFGPQGTGILYINSKIATDTIVEGGTGSLSEQPTQPAFLPDRFEAGTQNGPGIAGLKAGVDFILTKGISAIADHEMHLTKQLLDGLKRIPGVKVYGKPTPFDRTAVVLFNLRGYDSVDLANHLSERYGVCVRGGLHCAYLAHKTLGTLQTGGVRVSFSYFNTHKEVEKFLNIIDSLV